jgi:hypothetical protein
MTKTIDVPTRRDIKTDCRELRRKWSEQERNRRRKLAARKQKILLKFLTTGAPRQSTRVA